MVFLILSIILALGGVIGAVAPGIPGPILSWIALLLLSFHPSADLGTLLLVIMAVISLAVTVLDYIIPSLSTKKFGGTKAGVWGCNIGLFLSFIGLPFGPQGILGIIIWPFLGAMIGELIKNRDMKKALRSATGAFVGFLCGTGLKLIFAISVVFLMIMQLF